MNMTSLAGILATLAVSHLGGSALGALLARFGLLGFGSRLKIARHVLGVGKALRAAFDKEPTKQNREALQRWLEENDPQNRSGLGDAMEARKAGK